MVEMILDPYDAFREDDFTATIIKMGIQPYGEKETLKAYIRFDDEGADLTFFVNKSDGSEMIEQGDQEGHCKIKSFLDLGSFAKAAKKFGYETIIDLDPESLSFRTDPDLVGSKTSWQARKSGKRIDSEGTEKQYTNFVLVDIEGKKKKQQDANVTSTSTAPIKPSAASTSKPSKEKVTDAVDLKEAWQKLLRTVLDKPLNEAGIHQKIMIADKALKPDDPTRKLHSEMAKVRKATLIELLKTGFLTINEDGKYEIVL